VKCCCYPKNFIYYCKNISHKTARYEKSLAAKGIKISDTIKPQSLKIPSLKCVSKKRTEQVDDKKTIYITSTKESKIHPSSLPGDYVGELKKNQLDLQENNVGRLKSSFFCPNSSVIKVGIE
jgi:hypothetical protein